jgi:hypothetical protein
MLRMRVLNALVRDLKAAHFIDEAIELDLDHTTTRDVHSHRRCPSFAPN